MGLKPGWYLLFLIALYALVVTVAWQRSERALASRSVGQAVVSTAPEPPSQPARAEETLRYQLPLPGACLPQNPAYLPGAPRPYRSGVSYGFVFTDEDPCLPVVYGLGVVAAADGEVIKADLDYRDLDEAAFSALIDAVKEGADAEQMDLLRGREVWIRHPDGRVSVYAHLSRIAPQIRTGAAVRRGEWIGNVGNSGTSYAARGSRAAPRLLFELWEGEVGEGHYFGQGMDPKQLRQAARAFFAYLAPAPPKTP